MNKDLIDKTLKEVKQSYGSISSDFTRTRQKSWPRIDELLAKYIKTGDNVLDVGCGNGRLVQSLAGLGFAVNYVGLDNSTNLLEQARKNFGFQYKQVQIVWQESEMQSLPFADGVFSAVLAIASFHHLPSAELRTSTAREFYRVLRPGGVLIMANWNLFTLAAFSKYKLGKQVLNNMIKGLAWGDFVIPWKDTQGHVVARRYYHSFTCREVKNILEAAGFAVHINESVWLNKHKKSVAKSVITVAEKIDKLAEKC